MSKIIPGIFPKPPPISLPRVKSLPHLRKMLENVIDLKKVKIRTSVSGVSRLYAIDGDTLGSIQRLLHQKGLEYFTYQLKDVRPYKVDIKGLYYSITEDELKTELKKIEPPAKIKEEIKNIKILIG